MSLAREALDRLLASKPGVDIDSVDGQLVADRRMTYPGPPGPWVCVDFADGTKFAIWKQTGDIYRVDEHGAVEDDPVQL